MRFYKHYSDDFLAGTLNLALEEIGAYIILLDILYARDGDVPDDDQFMARTCRCDIRVWRRIRTRLFTLGKAWSAGGKLHAKRVGPEITSAKLTTEVARKLGRRSAEVRANMVKLLKDLNGHSSTVPSTAIVN